MADTTQGTTTARRATRRTAAARVTAARTEDRLEDQISRLQNEIKAIGNSLAKLTDEKVSEARGNAQAQYRSAVRSGKNLVDEVSEQVNSYEDQLTEAIRERPLTAVAGAIGVGFLIALLSRR